jgi:hypothetical protein
MRFGMYVLLMKKPHRVTRKETSGGAERPPELDLSGRAGEEKQLATDETRIKHGEERVAERQPSRAIF